MELDVMLKTLFSSNNRVKIITHFVTHPKGKFYLRELARLLNETVSPLQRELAKLAKIGFLISTPSANQVYYSLNDKFPLYPELKSMVLKTNSIGDILHKYLSKAGQIKYAFVYGSVARNTERTTSDIDLMLIGNMDAKTINPFIRRAEEALNREINYRIFEEKEIIQRIKSKDDFIANVLAEKKIMLIGDENELRRIGK